MTHNAFELARLADVASPDSPSSPGAEWLLTVASYAEDIKDEDNIVEAAGQVVPVYTYERWQVFVDLAAYSEDLTDLGDEFGGAEDMTSAAAVALYLIAERLLRVLVDERDENAEQDEED